MLGIEGRKKKNNREAVREEKEDMKEKIAMIRIPDAKRRGRNRMIENSQASREESRTKRESDRRVKEDMRERTNMVRIREEEEIGRQKTSN